MKLEEYAAQHAQDKQETQQAQENTLDLLARLTHAEEAERVLTSLSEKLQADIDAGEMPALILQRLAVLLFGTDSPQAAAIAAAQEQPAALEMQLAFVKAQQQALKRKQRQQEDALAATTAALADLAKVEKEIRQRSATAKVFDVGLADVLTFYKAQQLEITTGALDEAEALYHQYRSNPVATSVLHGCMLFLWSQNATGRVQFDLPQQEQLATLLQQTAGK